ncbi:hypothetical protein ICW40_07405 [Actinotalea ferrariae]|uniref:hypothetical protein n=1 Tax=Actinotalea ferrariae TaxID=1386098 RepID=UPI001C8C06F3|nr:hypothetical protein [Actinotalea ferrariae]MBX9244635.1 hypothetical protein [Actinotalea ferrariae]
MTPENLYPIYGDTPRAVGRFRIHAWLGDAMAKRGQGGRPSKGDRDQIITRPARPVGDAVRAAADAQGMTISDYIARVLAELHGLPQYAPEPRPVADQGELPILRGGERLQKSA